MWLEDKASYEVMLAEAWAGTHKSRDAGKRLVKLLRDAVQAHLPWAASELDALLIDGAMHKCRTWRQDQNPRIETIEGSRVKTTGGTRRGLTYEQLPFADMERTEIVHHVKMLVRQVETERATVAALLRLLDKLDQVPSVKTPREACAKLGTTVESVMAGKEIAA